MQNIEVTTSAIPVLIITMAVLFLMPVAYALVWKKLCGRGVSFMPLVIGAAGFYISARVLELGVHMVCIVADNPISRFINGSTPAYVIYGAFMAGIFEECGRYIIIKYIMKKNRTKENYVMYGIGHGGIEVWTITLMTVISLFAVAIMLKYQGFESTLKLMGITENTPENLAAQSVQLMSLAAGFSPALGAVYVLERIIAMCAHIGFTIIVAYGIEKNRIRYLFMAVLAHAAFDIFPAMYQRGAVGIVITEIWILVCAVILGIFGMKLYRKMK